AGFSSGLTFSLLRRRLFCGAGSCVAVQAGAAAVDLFDGAGSCALGLFKLSSRLMSPSIFRTRMARTKSSPARVFGLAPSSRKGPDSRILTGGHLWRRSELTPICHVLSTCALLRSR